MGGMKDYGQFQNSNSFVLRFIVFSPLKTKHVCSI